MKKRLGFDILLGFALTLSLVNISFSAGESELTQPQKNFIAAEKALRAGKLAEYERLRTTLSNYPLVPYLEYTNLRRRLSLAPEKEINTFVEKYSQMHLATRLRAAYLKRLAEKKSWSKYAGNYLFTSDIDVLCRYQIALYHTGYQNIALKNTAKIWLHPKSLPKSCDPLFAKWFEAGSPNNEQAWQRFELAINARQFHLAKYLMRFLAESDHSLATFWLQLQRNPLIVLQHNVPIANHPYHNKVRLYAATQTARIVPDRLDQVWSKMIALRNIDTHLSQNAINTIALVLAYKHDARAVDWFARLKDSTERDTKSHEWHLRSLLRRQDWPAIRVIIEQLPSEQVKTSQWDYWYARALEQTGDIKQSNALYKKLASKRSYYGFLSADRIEQPYQFNTEILNYTQTDIDSIEALDAVKRIKELVALKRETGARREWYYLLPHLDNEQLKKFSALLHQWGWHDRAILTMARSKHRDDLEIRFPLLYQGIVTEQAEKYQLDPSLMFAMIRQESAYNVKARSPAGARGLMQLMPGTARDVAKSLKLPLKNNNKLYNAKFNVTLGSSYLAQMLKRFDNNSILATAAYNAGPHRVKRWLPESVSLPADIWVDTIPFTETRNYVKNVHAYIAVYNYRQGITPVMISRQMKPVVPTVTTQKTIAGKLIASAPAISL
ncbi:MAG: transglycosylase SLT domain-containing protein [Gammaproteobacteria bacterium]|nr:transglycosylase SLT domain-containing protein [Gammaproteobacteria bacterium]